MYEPMDCPEVARALWTGYPRPPRSPVCPACGCECEDYYLDEDGNIKGCDVCLRRVDAADYEMEENAYG